MTPEDLLKFSIVLTQHFPQATDADGRLCWDLCKAYDLQVATRSIESHRLEFGAKAFRPDPRALAQICRRISQLPGDSPVVQRTTDYLAKQREEDRRAEADWARVDGLIAQMSDADLAKWKGVVLDEQEPFVRRALGKQEPRSSRRLKALIVERMERATVAA